MNRTKLKNYAPQARRDFIQGMTDRAAFYGLTVKNIEPIVERGDVAVIAGREHPRTVAKKRKQLENRIERHGFERTMEALAYTWFNRLVAIRFMELHGYLDHGYRVLSHPESKPTPEIVEHAEHVDLPGLKKSTVIDLKLAGNKEGELYRLLLIAQCNALHAAMPFLFEKIEDETELLLPDNLLHSDSLIRKLVSEIDEDDWQQVEIIGWLYQFYISERKDEVIGKVVASEDIPAATQLFTPNWIVKYLVQNTLGRQWLATYPQSALRQQMEYYIEPAEQTPEVQEQLKAITPTSLNPEELTLLDPACGSGHILVEGYDLFKAIYQERGYRAKDIPALILQKNVFGLEIDDRASQLAAFALMMKARADDRHIFGSEAKPNIVAIQESKGLNAADLTHALNAPINKEDLPKEYLFEEIQEEKDGLFSKKALAEKGQVSQADIAYLLELFQNGKTFGSLIQIPSKLAAKLAEVEKRLDAVLKFGDLTHASAHVLKPLLQQARFLARRYDAVVANPPYMGGKYFSPLLKAFVAAEYPTAKADLFASFIQRSESLVSTNGRVGLITMQSWLFTSAYEDFRRSLLSTRTIETMAHLGPRAFGAISGEVVQVAAFSTLGTPMLDFVGSYFRLLEGEEVEKDQNLLARRNYYQRWTQSDFLSLPRAPVAYWITEGVKRSFAFPMSLGEIATPRQGLATSDNNRFLRFWYEVPFERIGFNQVTRSDALQSRKKWFPYNKGGEFRKWYGNNIFVINWENDGSEVIGYAAELYGSPTRTIKNQQFYFRPCVTWNDITASSFSARLCPAGFIFDVKGSCGFPSEELRLPVLALLCSKIVPVYMSFLNPTTTFQVGDMAVVPFSIKPSNRDSLTALATSAVTIAQDDWNDSETAWEFTGLRLLHSPSKIALLSERWGEVSQLLSARVREMACIETQVNTVLISAYALEDQLYPEVREADVTLYRPDREEDIKRLLSYAIGCMMGRYSLDKPGLIYAHSGSHGFDPDQYKTFQSDDDGIVPLLGTDWGIQQDATSRIVEFVGVAWPRDHLEDNLAFIADSLGPNKGEQPTDTIRRYFASGFYKHHLSMYKKRPIYWLFSSGKQRAFQSLVYLHRYHEGTLARMRTEHVIPLQGQIAGRIEQLEGDKAKATSTSHRRKLQKEQDDLKKQQAELVIFEEKLKHAADQKIKLDLDDGVKVNYAKFGDLLAEAKAITGGKEDD